MKFVALGLSLLVTAGLLTGCSPRTSSGRPAEATEPSPTSTSIAAVKDTDGLVSLRWSDTGKLHSGRPVISVLNEECVTPVGVTVEETSSTVRVTAWGRKAKEPCAAVGFALHGPVALREPLGDRTLRHG